MEIDSFLQQEVIHLLHADPGIDASHILVSVNNGMVTLSGEVHSHTAKWMAKEAVRHIGGVKKIEDHLVVCDF